VSSSRRPGGQRTGAVARVPSVGLWCGGPGNVVLLTVDFCGCRDPLWIVVHQREGALQAVRRKGPRRVPPEDLSDPGLLGTGEHGGASVTEAQGLGQ
jgi:hypothetical protein